MLINKKSQTDLSGFYVVFNGSVLNEDSTNYGISHLCEHLKCRMFNKLYDIFDRYNITWNAL
jgi:predicted Zn-dependent peptidase